MSGQSGDISLSVVVPVHYEGANIEQTLAELARRIPVSHEIIVVYDVDEDPTVPVVQSLAGRLTTVRLAKNRVARGPSGALRTGFLEARANRILVCMGDLCDDLSQIPKMLDLVPRDADIAVPSRYCPGGVQEVPPSLKLWAPRTAGKLLRLFAGVATYDPTNSYKLYTRDVLEACRLRSVVSFSVTLEIVAKAHCLGYRIVEFPTTWRDRTQGSTKFRVGRSLVTYFPWFCLAMLRNRLFVVPRWIIRRIIGSETVA